jgi:hypothetical protein
MKTNLLEDNQFGRDSISDVEEEDVDGDEGVIMDTPFNPADINISTKQLTIDLLIKRMSAKPPEIDLMPDFQRSPDLWNEVNQSKLIESLLIQFPLPAFFLMVQIIIIGLS